MPEAFDLRGEMKGLSHRYLPSCWTKAQYRLPTGSANISVMDSVRDLLSALHTAFCIECVVRRTGLRTDLVIRETEVLSLRLIDGYCGSCGEAGPVFVRANGGASG